MSRPSIEEVAPRRASRREWLALPHRLHGHHPDYVHPLDTDQVGFLPGKKHPFHESAEMAFFLAKREGRPCGRICAIDNRAHREHWGDRTGFFGWFDAADEETAHALLDAAAAWLRPRGLTSLRGPISPSTNYVTGVLLGGDEGPPALMMPWNPPHYPAWMESAGLRKAEDLEAWWLDHHGWCDVPRWARIAERVRARAGVAFRPFDHRRWKSELAKIIEIYHAAWSKNWGFVPMTGGEVARMNQELGALLPKWMGAFVVDDEGRELAFWLALPDYNPVIRELKGKLFPFGIFRLLRAKRRLDVMRVFLMGVRPEHRKRGLDVLLYDHLTRTSRERGIRGAEASWILESNLTMRQTLERAGGRVRRRYRVYERPLDGPVAG